MFLRFFTIKQDLGDKFCLSKIGIYLFIIDTFLTLCFKNLFY